MSDGMRRELAYLSSHATNRYFIPNWGNYLIANKDDHAKNFAFIYRDGDWHFAPAYDLLPSDGINGFRTTSINDSIEPTKEDLFAVAIKAGLERKDAIEIFDNMEKCVKQFLSC